MAKAGGTRTALGYKELKAEIRAGQFRTLYVLFGDESFLIEKLAESLGQALIATGCEALDRVVLNGGGQAARLDLERLKAEVMTPPFLSAKKLVIVKNSGLLAAGSNGGRAGEQSSDDDDDTAGADEPDGADTRPLTESLSTRGNLKNRQEQLAAILEKLPDSVCLVMIEAKVDKRQKQLVSLIEQKGVLAEIGQEEPRVLRQWVEAECRRRGLQITVDAAESLIDRCDNSMQVISQEMGKLFLYCEYADNHNIELPLIAELSLPDLRGSIFDLTDALSDGRTERALQLVDTLIGQKEPVQLIQFMLARHLRQLICSAELGRPERITASLKVMPFVANRLARQARRLPIPVLEDLYARCVDTDTQVKTGKIGDRLALETYLAEAAEKVKFAVGR